MKSEHDRYIKLALNYSEKLKNPNPPVFNPLAEFLDYVSTKEIVHSRIISALLNSSGMHGEGESYIKEFFNLINIDYSKCRNINVVRERKVERILTEGGSRSIDILITYEDDAAKKHAIIIENKLNHAEYQYLQLEDYEESIKLENFIIDKIVLLHDIEKPILNNSHVGDKYVYLYPEDLYKWITSVSSNPYILSYAEYLFSLNNQNISVQNAKIMKNLKIEDIRKIKKVVDAYQNLGMVLRDEVIESVKLELPFPIETSYKKLDEGCKGLQLWNPVDYKRNGAWVVLFYPSDPADDDRGYDVYLYSYEENQSKATVIAENCNYEYAGKQEGYVYFRAQDGKYRYKMFPVETNRKALVDELVRLLKGLHE